MKFNVIAEFNNIVLSHKKCLKENDFHQFINGLYQAEGTMGAYFPKKDSLRLAYYFSIGQNYSLEALDVLLNLPKILGVGRVTLEFNEKDQPHIRYRVSNTKEIFNKIVPYFSLLYGQKRKDISTLKRIYVLSSNSLEYTKSENIFECELIHLVYCINP
jgi:LAGLIDADG endonuclease